MSSCGEYLLIPGLSSVRCATAQVQVTSEIENKTKNWRTEGGILSSPGKCSRWAGAGAFWPCIPATSVQEGSCTKETIQCVSFSTLPRRPRNKKGQRKRPG